MSILDELTTFWDVSDERAVFLVQANPTLDAGEIALKECLDEIDMEQLWEPEDANNA